MSNIKNHLNTILYVSKITNVKSKKLRILISVLFSNLSVVTDLAIIVSFATLITGVLEIENTFLEILINNSYLIPLLVIIRFSFLYIEKLNIQALQLSIRENLRSSELENTEEIINKSLNQTLGRTLITSLTTLLVLFSLYLLGGELIKNFALALIFGVVIGTYSSIYIAANALIMMGMTKDHLKVEEPENSDSNLLP